MARSRFALILYPNYNARWRVDPSKRYICTHEKQLYRWNSEVQAVPKTLTLKNPHGLGECMHTSLSGYFVVSSELQRILKVLM